MTTLPSCPHCKSCTVGPRQITVHENQSACPPEGFVRFAIACRLCGVQGPVSNNEEAARTMWSEWCDRAESIISPSALDTFITSLLGELGEKPFLILPEQRYQELKKCMAKVIFLREERDQFKSEYRQIEAANEGNIAQLMLTKQEVADTKHTLDSVRNQRDRANEDRGMLRAEINALKGGHAAQAKVISDLHESLALGRDAIDQNNSLFEQIRGRLDPHGLRANHTLVEVAEIAGEKAEIAGEKAEIAGEKAKEIERLEHRLDSVCKQRDTAEKDRKMLREQNQRLCDQVTKLTQQRDEAERERNSAQIRLDKASYERDELKKKVMVGAAPEGLADAIRHYLTTCGDVHPRNISPAHFASYLMQAGMKASPTDPSRLLAALEAAMPLLGTQKDAVKRPTSVELVYREPLTTAQLLRKQADELDQEDAIVMELRAALHDYLSGKQ